MLDTLTAFPNPGQKDYIPKNYDGKDHGYVTVRGVAGQLAQYTRGEGDTIRGRAEHGLIRRTIWG